MTADQAWKFVPILLPLAGSVVQVWSTLQKRMNWIRRAEELLTSFGWIFFLMDRAPLYLSYLLLIATFASSVLGLLGGGLIITAQWTPPQPIKLVAPYAKQIFNYSIWLAIGYAVLAVLIHVNAFPRLLQKTVYIVASPFFPELLFRPGWVNATWHVTREEETSPVNSIRSECESVANDIVAAWADVGLKAYQKHRAVKPLGFSRDELANFLLVSNTIEAVIHRLPEAERVQFGALYTALGNAGAAFFSPQTLRECNTTGGSLYLKLRDKLPQLPRSPLIESTVKDLVAHLVTQYRGRAYELARGYLLISSNAGVLERRLRRIRIFDESQAMRAQVIKLGVEMGVWPDMTPGPFQYPFSTSLARFLLNLGCLRTRPDVNVIAANDGFVRLSAWAMDRVVDAVEEIFQKTSDERITDFSRAAFGRPPRQVRRWELCREVDYFLWYQTRDNNQEGGIFGERATQPWKIDEGSFTRG